ncbi:MAG: TetR/AcrR family transcriptional regulator [Prevotellaceae bacterium]|nr:TetR/AcrR family transcriptional regulator [Prevotellaceae bacterium]
MLEAAEAEFFEKGYDNTKTVAIAKQAGVSHSMLHYYFRKKENLALVIDVLFPVVGVELIQCFVSRD